MNGEKVFVRGVVWTPGDLAALDTAVELGFNLVRVTGIAAYESDEFYWRCDELGLMVWQDLMFATFDYPLADDGFRATIEAEVRDQVTRLKDHPCVVVVCGSAEHEQQAAMFGVRPETRVRRRARRAAATGRRGDRDRRGLGGQLARAAGDLPIRVDTGIAQYFGVGAYLRDLPDARHSGVRFASECLAFANLPDPVVDGRRAAGQRRRLGLRRRPRALRAGAVRRGRDRGRAAAGDRRGDGRRLRRVAAPGVGVRRRHRAVAARPRARRRLGAARPHRRAQAGGARAGADPAADRGLVRRRGPQRARRARRPRPGRCRST